MGTRTSLLDKIAILLFFVLLTMASLCFGGTPKTITDKDNAFVLVSFKAKTVENKTYLNWNMVSRMNNFYFAVEKSTDGENYSVLEMRKGYLSPGNQPLLYSYTDEAATTGNTTTYYRIRMYEVDGASDNRVLLLSTKDLLAGNEAASVTIPNTTVNEFVQNFK